MAGMCTASAALAVTSPGHLLPPLDRHTPRAHVFPGPREQPLESALADARALLDQHGHLLVVHPSTLPTAHLHRLHTVRNLLESDRVALLPSALPPLGTAVLVRQLRQLSQCGLGPGVLGSAARLLSHYVHAGAELNSVARLDRDRVPVAPGTLAGHARSLLPGARFAVLASPRPRLVRIGDGEGSGARPARRLPGAGGPHAAGTPDPRADADEGPHAGAHADAGRGGAGVEEAETGLPGPTFATALTLARGRLGSDWVARTLAPRWRSGAVHEVKLPDESASWWGTGRLVEFAAAIPDVSLLHRLVASARRAACPWCGLELIGDRCAFCAAPVPSDPPAPAARTSPSSSSPPSLPARGAAPYSPYPPYDPRAPQQPPAGPHRPDGPALRHAVVADPRGL